MAGFGAGKSEVMAWSAIGDAAHSSDALIGLYAPTYDLTRLITAPRLSARLSKIGVPHKWNKQENIIYTSYPRFGDFVIRTMDNPERIVGYETYRAHVDELDTLKPEPAGRAWNQIVARNRQRPQGIARPFNRVSAYTTPEGFRFVYDRWVRNKVAGYEIIQAPTYSNPTLPHDYIDNLRATYPAELIEAYIEGRFVNLTSGTVYRNYDRERCRSTETIRDKEPLHIGQDFNVGAMASVINVERPERNDDGTLNDKPGWHVVGELAGILDTPSLIEALRNRFPGRVIYIYPDASGGSRKTINASESDIALLRRAGLKVRAKDSNPPVKDRILAMNTAYSKGRLWVNDKAAPRFAEAQEQQAYDKNGEPDKTTGHDHPNDAEGYFVHWTMPVRKPSHGTKELIL
ncbi:terminase family protein [Actibacterium sp. MT2.3-13A]|uniref:phage terminase large subunit family protein n=1 Tax=Actibacterium sp. MT2.3-13A TaxID=2828332 RepID=UPI0032C245AF